MPFDPIAALPWLAGNVPPSRDQQVFQSLKDQVNTFETNNAAASDAAKVAAANQANADLQREFAQHGIRWRVEDAKAAGIHPLYALGAQGAAAAPSFSVEGSGQDLSRAIHATRTEPERRFAELQMQKMQLENLALGLQIHGLAQSQFGPAQPGTLYQPQSSKTVVVDPGAPGREPGSINDYAYINNAGKYYITPSKDVKERTEDNLIQEGLWAFRNQMIPLLPGTKAPYPPSDPLMPGHKWHWNGLYYQMVPVKSKSSKKSWGDWVPKGSILRQFE